MKTHIRIKICERLNHELMYKERANFVRSDVFQEMNLQLF